MRVLTPKTPPSYGHGTAILPLPSQQIGLLEVPNTSDSKRLSYEQRACDLQRFAAQERTQPSQLYLRSIGAYSSSFSTHNACTSRMQATLIITVITNRAEE